MDSLGERMKWYEAWSATQPAFPPGLPIVIRIDGKGFSTWTRGLRKPYEPELMQAFQATAFHVMRDVLGEAVLAYGQSDEISFLLRPATQVNPGQWGNRRDKMVSLVASAITAGFNTFVAQAEFLSEDAAPALFDARAICFPSAEEALNCLIWRQQDAVRNSIQGAARAVASHSECMNKNASELQELLFQRGINWNDYPIAFKRGWTVVRDHQMVDPADLNVPEQHRPTEPVLRRVLNIDLEPPTFTADREYVLSRLAS